MKKKLFLICTCLFACISIAMAQVSTVTGVVISEEDNLSSTYKCNFLGADNKQ